MFNISLFSSCNETFIWHTERREQVKASGLFSLSVFFNGLRYATVRVPITESCAGLVNPRGLRVPTFAERVPEPEEQGQIKVVCPLAEI